MANYGICYVIHLNIEGILSFAQNSFTNQTTDVWAQPQVSPNDAEKGEIVDYFDYISPDHLGI